MSFTLHCRLVKQSCIVFASKDVNTQVILYAPSYARILMRVFLQSGYYFIFLVASQPGQQNCSEHLNRSANKAKFKQNPF